MISYCDKNINQINEENVKVIPSDQEILKISCPKCHHTGKFYQHGFYDRFLTIFSTISEVFFSKHIKIKVLRLKCRKCNKTHAVLNHEVIPYYRYSISFILEVLFTHFEKTHSVEEICDEFEITKKVFETFLRYFKDERIAFNEYFKDGSKSDEVLIEELINENIPTFLYGFFRQTLRHLFHFVASNTYSKYKIRQFHIAFILI